MNACPLQRAGMNGAGIIDASFTGDEFIDPSLWSYPIENDRHTDVAVALRYVPQ